MHMVTWDSNVAEMAIKSVSEKYGREFTPCFYENSDYLSKMRKICCTTEGLDPEHEQVEIYLMPNDEGKMRIADNYFSYFIRPAAEEYIGGMVSGEFPEYKVYRLNDAGAMPDELNGESTLEDLYRVKSDYWMSVKVYVRADPSLTEEDSREKMGRIEQQLLDSGRRFTIYLFAVSDEVYDSIGRYEQDDFWCFYAEHRVPDGEKYFYVYHHMILNGEVK